MEFFNWLEQSWLIVVAIIGGITLVWNFINKTLREIKAEIIKPVTDLKEEIVCIKKVIEQKEHKDVGVINALQSMQRRSLLEGFTKVLTAGEISISERETLSKQFDSYVELGGNSFIKEMYDEVCELPITNPKAHKKKRRVKNDKVVD